MDSGLESATIINTGGSRPVPGASVNGAILPVHGNWFIRDGVGSGRPKRSR
jgi:hypothetical protein